MLITDKKKFQSLSKGSRVRAILLPWAVMLLTLLVINTQDGGPNATSRFLTLRAMSEEASFQIDKRIGASADWSQTPDGHYYSNKAPGPMLLGFPTFFVLDQIPRIWEKGFRDENGHRHYPAYFQQTFTSLINQTIPLLFLTAFILSWLIRNGVSTSAQLYFILATFFGTTASLYFNNYSGHGFEAILQMGLLFALLTKHYRWCGFLAGASLLSDYTFAVQIPAFLLVLGITLHHYKEYKLPLIQIGIGAIVPAVLWIWYHTVSFGSPFLVAKHFENPIFLDTLNEEINFLGIFRMPRWDILIELLIGKYRGLLVTQPWILFLSLLAFIPFLSRKTVAQQQTQMPELLFSRKICALFCVVSLASLILVNMSYGSWHGGGAAGPRYLSGIFLCFALWMAIEFDHFPKPLKFFFIALLGISLLFRAMVYGANILAPPDIPLWQWGYMEFARPSKTAESRFIIYWVLLAAAYYWQKRRLSSNILT